MNSRTNPDDDEPNLDTAAQRLAAPWLSGSMPIRPDEIPELVRSEEEAWEKVSGAMRDALATAGLTVCARARMLVVFRAYEDLAERLNP